MRVLLDDGAYCCCLGQKSIKAMIHTTIYNLATVAPIVI
jgi:hypothetical protein